MNNQEVKQEMKRSKVPQWKIADELGICEMTLIRWLRHELSEDKVNAIRTAITKLKNA